MAIGMANTQKVTVTLAMTQLEAIRALVESGEADSVSGFVTHAVSVSLDDGSGWARCWPSHSMPRVRPLIALRPLRRNTAANSRQFGRTAIKGRRAIG
jgi:hypothetical protein